MGRVDTRTATTRNVPPRSLCSANWTVDCGQYGADPDPLDLYSAARSTSASAATSGRSGQFDSSCTAAIATRIELPGSSGGGGTYGSAGGGGGA